MASITSSGIGSGLDIEGLITSLMNAEQAPLTQLATKEVKIQSKISALGTLKGALSTFQSSVKTLTDASKFMQAKATSSDSDVATVSASNTAQAGSYSLEVTQLAQSHKLKSGVTFSDTTAVVGTGKITIQFGDYSSGSFVVNPDKAAATIEIDSSKNTLAGVRDAINAAEAGVKATVINDGTGNRLVLTSSSTGLANSMKITVSEDGDGLNTDNNGLSRLTYDAGTGGTRNLAEVQVAKNALFTLDGLSITKASNTVTDVIAGVTLNLKTKTESAETITVSRDTASVADSVQAFVKAYNTLASNMSQMGSYSYNADTKTGSAGALQGETSLRTAQWQLRSVLNGALSSGTYTRLSQVGITYQKDGTLALDSAKLTNALESNFADVASLFTANGVPTDSGISFTGASDNTKVGNYAGNVTKLATKGVLNGSAITTPVVVDADSDSLKFKIDGIQSGAIALTQKTYTGAELAAELQTKINGDSALKAGGVSVTVAWNSSSGRLEVSSAKYGSSSKVELTSQDSGVVTKLGLAVGLGTAGEDVAGTIDGMAATGNGQALTASEGAAIGLKLTIQGTTTGYRGTIAFNRGFAYQLDKQVDSMLSSTGSISARVDGLSASIKDIGTSRETLQRRLVDMEKRYRAQFSALDVSIASMKSTSTYLSQQLAGLSSLISSR